MNDITSIQKKNQFDWIPEPEKFGTIDHLTRDQIIVLTSNFVASLVKRISGERFREQEGDQMRVAYCRLLISALQAYRSFLNDQELDDLRRQIDSLKFVRKEVPS